MEFSPEILTLAAQLGLEPEEVAGLRDLFPEQVKELTDAYLVGTDQGSAYPRLVAVKDLAIPHLIAAFDLEDPFQKNGSPPLQRECPASQALSLLERGVHPELKRLLLRWVARGDEDILRTITSHLVAFGSDDLLPAVEMLFDHPDEFVSSGARGSALGAIKAGRAQPLFRKYVWEHSVRLLHSRSVVMLGYDPTRLIAALDQNEAKKVLLSPEVLRADHPLLPEILSMLNQLKSPAPADFLAALIDGSQPVDKFKSTGVKSSAIFGLISHDDPRAAKHVENILSAPDRYGEHLVLTAWRARFKLRGIEPVVERVLFSYGEADEKIAALSRDERDILLISGLAAAVMSEGFQHWYSSEGEDGETFNETWRALKKIGAPRHAKLVARANALFGWWGPPLDREKLQAALDSMSSRKLAKMQDLTLEWFHTTDWTIDAMAWEWKRLNGGQGR